ncbi:MAG: cupin domain-containing protein, partial [Flavobacteriales bacterium]
LACETIPASLLSLCSNPYQMTRFILTTVAVIAAFTLNAQQVMNIESFQPELNYENIHVYQIDNDPLTSTFLIWVKDNVPPHFHKEHTEVVYVIQGNGTLVLGDQTKFIKEGDYIFIPKGTPHSVKVSGDKPMKVLSVQTPEFDGSDRHSASPE